MKLLLIFIYISIFVCQVGLGFRLPSPLDYYNYERRQTTTQEEVTEKRKEAVDAAVDAYERADVHDPPQAEDVDRAKRAAQEAVGMDPNISEEEAW